MDSLQIPPVRTTKEKTPEIRECAPMRPEMQGKLGIDVFQLTTVRRQALESKILSGSIIIREHIKEDKNFRLPEGDDLKHIDGSQIEGYLREWFLDEKFDEDADYAKVIAWTNERVNFFNEKIRKMRYGQDVERLAIGESLIADTVIKDREDNIMFKTSDEMVVRQFTVRQEPLYKKYDKEKKDNVDVKVKFYDVLVEGEDGEKYIHILHEDSQADYDWRLKQLQAFGKEHGGSAWRDFYRWKELFAQVKYNYAITCHKCLPLCSKVLTFNGIKTIGKMKNDDNVITSNGSIQQVLDKFETGEKRVHVIKTRSGRIFMSSEEHRFLTEYGYQKASSIESGNHLALWRSSERSLFSFDVDYWIVGYLVGDGCYSYKSNRVDVTLDKSSNLVDLITLFFERKGNVKTYYKKAGNAITISVESKSFRDWLEQIGLNRVTGSKKSTPSFSSKVQKANFIRGLFDADGSCSFKKRCIRFVNISRTLIEEVSMLLQEFGIICSIRKNKVYSKSHSQSYTLSIYGESVLFYKEQIGFSSDYKMENLKKSCFIGDLGKTNVDFIPNSGIIIDYFVNLFSDNKSIGGLGNKGKGLYANKNRHVSYCLKYGRLSYSNLRILIDHCLQRNLYVPEWIVEIIKNWYFYDEVIESFLSDEKCPMVDIEVKQEHNFIYNGAIVHNSQGSGYDNVMVIWKDIMNNKNVIERNRIFYTAMTRSKKLLVIV